jgi:phosphatidylglycerophosphate synthase
MPPPLSRQRLPVLLYAPNIVCYARVVLAFVGLHFSVSNPRRAIVMWTIASVFDWLDGILARWLNQSSSFGVFLDIAADNVLRSSVWFAVAMSHQASSTKSASYVTMISCFVVCLEWFTMACTQLHAISNDTHWKHSRAQDPWIVLYFFANNFKNPLGVWGIFGLFAANLFAYGEQHPDIVAIVPYFTMWQLIAYSGRLLSLLVEIRVSTSFILHLLDQDQAKSSSKAKS